MSRPYVQTVPTLGLGEAPHWNASKEELLFVDNSEESQTVHRYIPRTGQHFQVQPNGGGRVSMVVPVEGEDDKFVMGNGKNLNVMQWDGVSSSPSSLITLFTIEPDQPNTALNDGKCDDRGRLWIGTLNRLALANAHLYKVTSNLEIALSGVQVSNGLIWNREKTQMFYIDTVKSRVDVYDFEDVEGTLSNRRTLYSFLTERGFPDGMTIDANGNLWVACYSGGQLINLDPSTGQKIADIQLPVTNPTSIAFGGPNLDMMFVTSSINGLSEAEKLNEPLAGSLLQIANVGVRGLSAGHNFRMS